MNKYQAWFLKKSDGVFNKKKFKKIKINTANTGKYSINPSNILRHYDNNLIGMSDESINKMVDRNHIDMESERLKIDAFDKVMEIQGEFNCAADYEDFYSDMVRVIHEWQGEVAKMQSEHRERFGE